MTQLQVLTSEASTFVGYCYLEDWAQAVDPSRPVLAALLVEPGRTTRGMRTDRLVVSCMQTSEPGTVLYCRVSAGAIVLLHGEPLSVDWRNVRSAWLSLWREVSGFLSEQGLRARRATVAVPESLILLEGRAGFLQYDAEASVFRRVEGVPDTVAAV